MRDTAAAAATLRLARLAARDIVGNVSLGDTLTGRHRLDTDALIDLIARRSLDKRAVTPRRMRQEPKSKPRLNTNARPCAPMSETRELYDETTIVAQVARILNCSPKAIRTALRSRYGTPAARPNWVIDEGKETFLRSRFAQR